MNTGPLSFVAQASTDTTYTGSEAVIIFIVIIVLIFTLFGLFLLPGLIVAASARRRIEKLLNNNVSTVVTQYDPPHGFLPAEIALLHDMRVTRNDIVATLFHLEQRGIIALKARNQVEILDQAAYDGLFEFEKIAVRTANGTSTTNETRDAVFMLASGQQVTFSLPAPKSLGSFERAIQQHLLQKGIKMNNYRVAFILRVLIIALIFWLLPLLSVATPVNYNGVDYPGWSAQSFSTAIGWVFAFGFFLTPAYIIFASILVLIWTKIAGRYWLNSKQARAFWPELEGYRIFLKQVDLDNIQFESTTGDKPVTKSLPYALVFGLETKWQKRLQMKQQS